MFPLVSLLLGMPSARAACPTTEAALAERLEAIERGDADAIGVGVEGVLDDLDCLDEPTSRRLAAVLHRCLALQAFVARDFGGVVDHYQAAWDASEGASLSTEVAPQGHQLQAFYREAAGRGPVRRRPVTVESGSLIVDGVVAVSVPEARPALLQHLDPSGTPQFTGLWDPERPLPFAAPPPPAIRPELATRTPPAPVQVAPQRNNTGWWVATGAAAAVTAGLWTGALVSRGAFTDRERAGVGSSDHADTTALWRRTNGLGYAAQGATVVTAGLGIAAVLR